MFQIDSFWMSINVQYEVHLVHLLTSRMPNQLITNEIN